MRAERRRRVLHAGGDERLRRVRERPGHRARGAQGRRRGRRPDRHARVLAHRARDRAPRAADPLFDPRTTPSRMGAISEGFRLSPGTIRSIHPTHSTAVRGRGAEEIVAGHETAATPFGEGTPFPRIVERDALQLFFGCGTGAMTMYHSFECTRVPPFPLDVFADRRFSRALSRPRRQRDHGRNARPQPGASSRAGSTPTRACRRCIATRSSRRAAAPSSSAMARSSRSACRRSSRSSSASSSRASRSTTTTCRSAQPTEPPQDRVDG